MYEQHFQLQTKPFSLSPDPRFIYFSKRHAQAYAMLEYGISEQVGFAVITGEIGSGKTTLMRKMIAALGDDINLGLISNTHQGMEQIVPLVLDAFGAPLAELPEQETLYYRVFTDFLVAEYNRGRRSLLVIDEAQNLSVRALEQLRLLSNINVDGHLLLQTILIGQPELRETLQRPELKQFAQRISVDYFLPRLSKEESVDYINHRLSVAGAPCSLFSGEAKLMLAYMSKGLPRVINNLADMSLVYAFGDGASFVDKATVVDVVRDKALGGILPMQTLSKSKGSAQAVPHSNPL